MNPLVVGIILGLYFLVLLGVSYYTGKNANNQTFFIGNRNSNWLLVAFGMIGTSLSGVTFVSVPGTVGATGFNYFQVVIGYFIGYFVVAFVLLPLYYRLKLTSIYTYLLERFGFNSYKTGAVFFIVSRTLGATARLYLVINILDLLIFHNDITKSTNISWSFVAISVAILLMILAYTFKGGVKTIVWTDMLQTTFMLGALLITVGYILTKMNLGIGETWNQFSGLGYNNMFNLDFNSKDFFLKSILGGMFITISMTGLDQEMMQKNISIEKLGNSQKNMFTFSVIMVLVNFIFLFMGGLLYLYAKQIGVDAKGDDLYPILAFQKMSPIIAIVFIVGLISALFPSADGAITALTSSFCIDILGINRAEKSEEERSKIRKTVHLIFTFIFLILVIGFKILNDKSIIGLILKIAGYTYGPLLGLFAFGILTKYQLKDKLTILVCLAAPILTYILSTYLEKSGAAYQIGIEVLIINGLLTFLGLFLIRKKDELEDLKIK